MTNRYEQEYRESLENPDAFWGRAAEDLHWYKRWDKVLDDSNPPFYRWFAGAETNTCYNAVDRHVEEGRAEQAAIIYDSPITGKKRTTTYAELKDQVSRFAGVLKSRGVEKGDRVIIYMPMIPEALVAMLACARLGAIHSVVFGGFAAHELATRINDAEPKAIVCASCGLEPNRVVEYKPLIDAAIDEARRALQDAEERLERAAETVRASAWAVYSLRIFFVPTNYSLKTNELIRYIYFCSQQNIRILRVLNTSDSEVLACSMFRRSNLCSLCWFRCFTVLAQWRPDWQPTRVSFSHGR